MAKKKEKPKGTERIIVLVTALWLLLAALFARYDLDISNAAVNQGSSIGMSVEHFGEVPGLIVALMAVLILGANIKDKQRIFAEIFAAAVLFYFAVIISRAFAFRIDLLSGVIIAIICIAASTLAIRVSGTKQFSEKSRIFAKTTTILFSASLIFVQALKLFWGRVRFRDLAASAFTPWFLPQGINGNYSFPSGHAMMAWMLLPLILINMEQWKKKVLLAAIIAFGLFVSFARVYVGAHYASDVLFSSGFVIVLFLVLYGKQNKFKRPNKSA